MPSIQAASRNPSTLSKQTPSPNQGEYSDPDSPPAPSLTHNSPDLRSSTTMPDCEYAESNIGSNDAGRYYTEFSRLLKAQKYSFRGSLQSEYGAADEEFSLGLADEEYDTEDVGAPEWSELGLDTSRWETSRWDNALWVTLVIIILVALVVSVIAVLVRIS